MKNKKLFENHEWQIVIVIKNLLQISNVQMAKKETNKINFATLV